MNINNDRAFIILNIIKTTRPYIDKKVITNFDKDSFDLALELSSLKPKFNKDNIICDFQITNLKNYVKSFVFKFMHKYGNILKDGEIISVDLFIRQSLEKLEDYGFWFDPLSYD
jgi:hypothetical protein